MARQKSIFVLNFVLPMVFNYPRRYPKRRLQTQLRLTVWLIGDVVVLCCCFQLLKRSEWLITCSRVIYTIGDKTLCAIIYYTIL